MLYHKAMSRSIERIDFSSPQVWSRLEVAILPEDFEITQQDVARRGLSLTPGQIENMSLVHAVRREMFLARFPEWIARIREELDSICKKGNENMRQRSKDYMNDFQRQVDASEPYFDEVKRKRQEAIIRINQRRTQKSESIWSSISRFASFI